jgi:alkylhydroperoxidase family enzyme
VRNEQEFPMPRISEITDDRDDPTLKPIFDKQRELFGDILNPTKVLAHCPPILRAAGAMGQAIEQSGQLPKGLVPLIYTRVATINGCPF